MNCISVARHRCGFHRCFQQARQDRPANRSTSCWALNAVFHSWALSHGVLCFLSCTKGNTTQGEFASTSSRSLNSARRSPDSAGQREARNLHYSQPLPPRGDAEDGWVLTFQAQLEETWNHQRVAGSTLFQNRHFSRQFPCPCSLSKAPNPLIVLQ